MTVWKIRPIAVVTALLLILSCSAISHAPAQDAPEETGYPISRDELIDMASMEFKTNRSIAIVLRKHIVGDGQFDLMTHQLPKSWSGMPPFKYHYYFLVQDGSFPSVLGSREASGEAMIMGPRSPGCIPGAFLPPLRLQQDTTCTLMMAREALSWGGYATGLCEGSIEWVEQPIGWNQMQDAISAGILVVENPEDLPASKIANSELIAMQSRVWERPIRGEDAVSHEAFIAPTRIRWGEDKSADDRPCVVPLGAEDGELFLMRSAYAHGDLMTTHGYRVNSPSKPMFGENLYLRFPLGESTFYALTKRSDLHKADLANGEWRTGWSLSGPFRTQTSGLCIAKEFRIDLTFNARPISPVIVQAIEEKGVVDLAALDGAGDVQMPASGAESTISQGDSR